MSSIIIHDVGLRDGLQVEKKIVSFETKIKWARYLIDSGITHIQLGSFVRADNVPQMADTDALFSYVKNEYSNSPSLVFSGLVLNEKGLERAFKCDVDLFCMGVSASDTHSRKNTNMTTDEALPRIIAMGKDVLSHNKKLQVSVQSAFGCGYEGMIPQEKVVKIVEQYLAAGFKNISLADTAGFAHPQQVTKLYEALFSLNPNIESACHFHNTYGLGLTNCFAALSAGVTYFESAFGGLGGCPFTKLPAGNIATEDLIHSFQRINLCNDLNLGKIIELSHDVSSILNKELPGLIYRTGGIKI